MGKVILSCLFTGALIIYGLLCSFFVLLNLKFKEEIWETIYERYINDK